MPTFSDHRSRAERAFDGDNHFSPRAYFYALARAGVLATMPRGAASLLWWIADRCDRCSGGNAWGSQRQLASSLGLGRGQLRRVVVWLVSHALLEVGTVVGGRGNDVLSYRLLAAGGEWTQVESTGATDGEGVDSICASNRTQSESTRKQHEEGPTRHGTSEHPQKKKASGLKLSPLPPMAGARPKPGNTPALPDLLSWAQPGVAAEWQAPDGVWLAGWFIEDKAGGRAFKRNGTPPMKLTNTDPRRFRALESSRA